MEKKYFGSILAIMMVSMLNFGFISCGGDDDSSSGGGTPSTNVGKLDKDFSKRIKSVGNISYYYNDNDLLDYIVSGNHRYDFTYNPNTIVETRNGKDKVTYNVSYDGLGHIIKFEFTKVYEEGKNTEKFMCSTTLTYGNSEQLTNISGYTNSEINGVKGFETISTALNWKNNLLMSVVCDETEQEEGDEKEQYRETYTYSYDNANINDYHNKHHQYTPSIVKFLGDEFGDDDLARALAYVGLLGRGPLYLPVSSEDTDEDVNTNDSKPYYRKYTRNFKYGFNSDGSVSYTNVDGSRTNFTYEDIKK